MKFFRILILYTLCFNSGCVNSVEIDMLEISDNIVPLPRLLSMPENYDGKRIATIGILIIKFKEQMLYFSESDAEHGITLNGLKLDFSNNENLLKIAQTNSSNYVAVWGEFEKNNFSQDQGIHVGSIINISEISPVDDWGRNE